MSETTTTPSTDNPPVELHCRVCHRPVSPEVHAAFVALRRGLRHPFGPIDRDSVLCPEHLGSVLEREATAIKHRAERQGAQQYWRHLR